MSSKGQLCLPTNFEKRFRISGDLFHILDVVQSYGTQIHFLLSMGSRELLKDC